MPSPIEQALTTLVPTLNSLPPDLVGLANALLAQSRANAASLKADEEIGRTYACAHLACERLKTRLALDKLQPRPPCPPRVYKKLYGYLDNVLTTPITPKTAGGRFVDRVGSGRGTPVSGRGTRTPGSGGASMKRAKDESEIIGDDTPSHRVEKRTRTPTAKALEVIAGGFSSRKRRKVDETTRVPKTASDADTTLPAFVEPMTAKLSQAFELSQPAQETILEGLRAIVDARGYNPSSSTQSTAPHSKSLSKARNATSDKGPLVETQLPALLIINTIYVHTRLHDTEIDNATYIRQRTTAIKALQTSPQMQELNNDSLLANIETFLRAFIDEGWTEMEWFSSIKPLTATNQEQKLDSRQQQITEKSAGKQAKTPLHRREKHAPRPRDGAKAQHEAEEEDEDNIDCPAGLRPGLGTMFQDPLDWLSEERRNHYKTWEKKMWLKIEVLERQESARGIVGVGTAAA